MTKAEEKRRKDATNALTAKLSRVLIDFKNRYYQSYSDWNILQIELKRDRFPTGNEQELSEQYLGKSCKDTFFVRYLTSHQRRGNGGSIEQWMIKAAVQGRDACEKQLERKAILQHQFYNEAAKSYQTKFDRMVKKLVDEGFRTTHLRVEFVSNSGSQLEFLISDHERECHARAIWVEGAIKAPHYRFITTTRNK